MSPDIHLSIDSDTWETRRYEVRVTRWHADTNRDYAWGVYDHGTLIRRGFSADYEQAERDGRAWLAAHMDACEEWADGDAA